MAPSNTEPYLVCPLHNEESWLRHEQEQIQDDSGDGERWEDDGWNNWEGDDSLVG